MRIDRISLVYNGSLLVGLGLVFGGAWQFNHGAALLCTGALVLAFTVYGNERLLKKQSEGER